MPIRSAKISNRTEHMVEMIALCVFDRAAMLSALRASLTTVGRTLSLSGSRSINLLTLDGDIITS
jgi:hypothetical protein